MGKKTLATLKSEACAAPPRVSTWWAFTLFIKDTPPTFDPTVTQLEDVLQGSLEVLEYRFQVEETTTERLHYQGVLHVRRRLGKQPVRRLFGGYEPHLRPSKSIGACVNYTGKADSHVAGPWDFSRTNRIRHDAVDGTFRRTTDRHSLVLRGPTACGKTTIVNLIAEYAGAAIYAVPGRNKNQAGRWIGPYKGEPIVLIDEWHPDDFTTDMLKLIGDRNFNHSIPTSMGGKSVRWTPDLVFILTNKSMAQVTSAFSDPALRTRWVGRAVTPCPTYSKPPVPSTIFDW